MTGSKIVLTINAESTEGIHDFIEILETIVERIKEGYEHGGAVDPQIKYEYNITPHV